MNRKHFTLGVIVCLSVIPCWGFRFSDQPQVPATSATAQPDERTVKTTPSVTVEKKTPRIAFVNMEKIFEEFPETKVARQEMDKMIAKDKEEIAAQELKITKLKAEIADLQSSSVYQSTTTVAPQSFSVQQSSVSAALGYPAKEVSFSELQSTSAWKQAGSYEQPLASRPSAELLTSKQTELKQIQDGLDKYIADAERKLTEWESKAMRGILGKFNQAVCKIAEEENFNLIVDKNSVLYGEQGLDITERIQKYLEKSADELIEIEEEEGN